MTDNRISVELVGGPACGKTYRMEPTAKALVVPVMLPDGFRRATYVPRCDRNDILDFAGFATISFEPETESND